MFLRPVLIPVRVYAFKAFSTLQIYKSHWEANCQSPALEILFLLRNLGFHYRVRKIYWARWIQSTFSYHMFLRPVLIPVHVCAFKAFSSLKIFPNQNFICVPHIYYSCYICHPIRASFGGYHDLQKNLQTAIWLPADGISQWEKESREMSRGMVTFSSLTHVRVWVCGCHMDFRKDEWGGTHRLCLQAYNSIDINNP
jgi:hypothetical protein